MNLLVNVEERQNVVMKIAVHVSGTQYLFDQRWCDCLKKKGIDVLMLDMKANDVIEKVRGCDGVMWHYEHSPIDKQVAPKVLAAIEHNLQIPVWPNYNTRWHFDEKISQYYLFEAKNIPCVKTWVFWNYKEAMEFVNNYTEYPLVFKLSVGAGAANVIKVDSVEKARILVEKMFNKGFFPYSINEFALKDILQNKLRIMYKYLFHNEIPLPKYYQVQKEYIYLQEFIPDNQYDIRVTVIGNRAFGFIRYNRKGDFRASGSGKIDVNPRNIPMEAVKLAYSISEQCGFQSMGYDFLIDSNKKLIVNEISYGYASKAIYDCPGYWDKNLEWHEGHMWPEEAHVEDFIEVINKKYK